MVSPENQPNPFDEVITLLEDNWTASNVKDLSFGFAKGKNLHTGWYNGDNPRPQISVSTVNNERIGQFMDGTGGNPGYDNLGSIDLHVWIWRNTKDNNGNDVTISSPDETGPDICNECIRIAQDNPFSVSNWAWIQPTPWQNIGVDRDADYSRTVYHYMLAFEEYHKVEPV